MDHEVARRYARRYAWCKTGVPAPNADEVLAVLNDLDVARERVAELETELAKVKGYQAELSERCYRKDLELDELRAR